MSYKVRSSLVMHSAYTLVLECLKYRCLALGASALPSLWPNIFLPPMGDLRLVYTRSVVSFRITGLSMLCPPESTDPVQALEVY